MKKSISLLQRSLCIAAVMALVPLLTFAQARRVTGVVTDENRNALQGVAVVVPGSPGIASVTDQAGRYAITLPDGANSLRFSFVGYNSETLTTAGDVLNVELKPENINIGEIVVVGYGTQRKGDLTGSVANVSAKDFQDGVISSAEQLISGKVSGVQIMSSSGSPTSGSTIRIRGGASLNASNDPLIVLDGLPLESGGISGNTGNFLSLINPSDIESMTILKDASSTAIYGSRASNGVILITTKKGAGDRLRLTFSTTNSISTKTKTADMLGRGQFEDIIRSNGTASQISLLGDSDTSWEDKIFQTAFGTDNNIGISGRIAPNWPLRVSVGYYNQDGILRTDNVERLTGSVVVSPSFLDNHLKVSLNVKGSHNENRFADNSSIWAAATYNPTIPVYSGNEAFGGYTEGVDNSGNPVTGAVFNPVGLLKQNKATSKVSRVIGNIDLDYQMHFLKELRFHLTAGYDYAEGKGKVYVPATAAQYYTTSGRDYSYGPQKNTNRMLTTYFNYNKYIDSIKSSVDATAGYEYQYWKSTTPFYAEYNTLGEAQTSYAATDQRHALISYYGRINYSYDSRYLLTATVRHDGTSRFSKDNRWGTFPSVAVAWRMSQEAFLRNNKVVSDLKFRASYGITGQQDGIGNYNYLPVYTISQNGAQVQFGDQWYYSYRPEAYVEDLKWETTKSWNIGFDVGFLENRLSATFDYYTRKTEDLLATVPSPAGVNFDKTLLTNVGNVDSRGIEFTINATPIDTKDFTWDISYNFAWQKMKVKNLSATSNSAKTNTLVGPSIDGYQFQVLTEGYAPYMFYVYHQLYDEKTGKPIEGAYADLNDDGEINSSDLYRYHSPAPDYIMGLNTSFRYKKLTLGMNFRANIGNYVYNGMAMNTGAWNTVSYNSYQLNNLNKSYLDTGFHDRQYLSDYYVKNASFLKLDNISLGYNFGKITKWVGLSVSANVQNVFTITRYKGVDPEVPNGMDLSFYPRPRIFSLSLGFDF